MTIQAKGLVPLIQVHDMRTSVAWYRGIGFDLISQSRPGEDFHWCRLRLGEAELMLNTIYDDGEQPGTRDLTRAIGHGDTCNYVTCPDVDAVHAALVERDFAPSAPNVTPYQMKQIYLTDPDGYGLCFQWPA